jgi:hypothetical protein
VCVAGEQAGWRVLRFVCRWVSQQRALLFSTNGSWLLTGCTNLGVGVGAVVGTLVGGTHVGDGVVGELVGLKVGLLVGCRVGE